MTPALAQNVTTGSISGVIADQQGGVLPGVTVDATHQPTGTQYSAVTDADGRFLLVSVRIGGPYTVTATLSGFRTQEQVNLAVPLGETLDLTFTLPIATVTETVTVEAEFDPIINSSRTGPTANVSTAQIENLPSVSRSLEDFARTSPYFSPIAVNAEPGALSVAGRNNRYNNVQIDGAVNNDLFGLAATGTPGGQTEAQPISIDAIEELQLLVAPYDVRQGGFSGGGVNAVTKSGTNTLGGSAYYLARNQDLVGTYTDPITNAVVAAVRNLQRQARRRQRRRADRAEQGVLLRQLRAQPPRHPVRVFRRRQLWCRFWPRVGGQPHREHAVEQIWIRSGRPGPVYASGRQQQDVRPRRCQPRVKPSADRSSQLYRRDERHRTPEPHGIFLPGLFLSLPQRDELHGRAVEQHVRKHVQRAARDLPAGS